MPYHKSHSSDEHKRYEWEPAPRTFGTGRQERPTAQDLINGLRSAAAKDKEFYDAPIFVEVAPNMEFTGDGYVGGYPYAFTVYKNVFGNWTGITIWVE